MMFYFKVRIQGLGIIYGDAESLVIVVFSDIHGHCKYRTLSVLIVHNCGQRGKPLKIIRGNLFFRYIFIMQYFSVI